MFAEYIAHMNYIVLSNIELAQSGWRLFSYLNKIINNLINTDNIFNDQNKGCECAQNGDDVINLIARFCNRRTHIKFFKDEAPHT